MFQHKRSWRLAATVAFGAVLLGGVAVERASAQLTPSDLIMVYPHAVRDAGNNNLPHTMADAFSVLTNGNVDYGVPDNVDTWIHDQTGFEHFVGLRYDTPNRFDTLTVHLGNQYVDGGSWREMPKLYILKNPTMVGNQVRPGRLPSHWTEVTGHTETTGYAFDPLVVPGPGSELNFDLSGVPEADRTGYAWALVGQGNYRASDQLWNFTSFTELSATGVPGAAPPIVAPTTPRPVNIVSNNYNAVTIGGDWLSGLQNRGLAFEAVTNGVVNHGTGGPTIDFQQGQVDGYDNYQGDAEGLVNDFTGLLYDSQVRFDTITVDMGNQFPDGGDWDSMPRIFILKNPVDTDRTLPETDPTNWMEITGFTETTGHVYGPYVVEGPGGTMTFDLSSIAAADRTGWGFAVGGVDGNASIATEAVNFISITELSITGEVVGSTPATPGDFNGDGNVDGADFVIWQTNFPKQNGGTLATGDANGDGAVDGADFVIWQTNFPTVGGSVTPVPEPATWALALLGGAIALAYRRRK